MQSLKLTQLRILLESQFAIPIPTTALQLAKTNMTKIMTLRYIGSLLLIRVATSGIEARILRGMARRKISNDVWVALEPLIPAFTPSPKGGRRRTVEGS